MRIIKRSGRLAPKVSLVLVDWSVRESFHLLHYLSQQTVERDQFEVTVIEYYDRISDAVLKFEQHVDNWIVLDMPSSCYYHKHLMYNAGIAVSRGEIILIGDSDAMVKASFIATIIRHFEQNPQSVLHIDQFRNARRAFFPFNYPTFDEVLGEGCINNAGGKTSGIRDSRDPIHSRNYGACMCARRQDLIAVGGADMHIDYLGHICGPYDMTFRLANFGRREVWLADEFMYHTWHPGQAGVDNYLGPHDGRHVSTTALETLVSGRIMPLVENTAIADLRTGRAVSAEAALARLIDPHDAAAWNVARISSGALTAEPVARPLGIYRGFRLIHEAGRIVAKPITARASAAYEVLDGRDLEEIRRRVDAMTPRALAIFSHAADMAELACNMAWVLRNYVYGLPKWLSARIGTLDERKALQTNAGRTSAAATDRVDVSTSVAPAVAGTWRRLREAISARISQLFPAERHGVYGLAASIYNVVWGYDSPHGPPHVAVLVEWQRIGRYLQLLGWLALLPKCRITLVSNLDEYRSAIKTLNEDRREAHIFIPAQIHMRFYTAIPVRPGPDRFHIV